MWDNRLPWLSESNLKKKLEYSKKSLHYFSGKNKELIWEQEIKQLDEALYNAIKKI